MSDALIQVGKYFTLQEFMVSQEAARKGISNRPPAIAIEAIRLLCANVLDPLRDLLGAPIIVTSGYRSKRVNWLVGGAITSQHMKGEAADIICPSRSVDEVFDIIRAGSLPFDQLIHEFGAWNHVSYRRANPRRQVLRATLLNGKTVYKPA